MGLVFNVGLQGEQFAPLNHEQVATTIDEVEFEKDKGHLVVSDIRVVWYKNPKSQKGEFLKGFLKAAAVGVVGAAVGGELRQHGGFVGGLVGRGLQTATTATATAIVFKSLTSNQLIQRGPDGSAETLAIPIRAIKNATVQKDTLVIMLAGGDQLLFKSKNAKMFSVASAQIQTARDANKCPYCGQQPAPGAITCPRCGASVSGGGAPAAPAPSAPARPGGAYTGPGGVSVTLPTVTPQMMQAQCPYCRVTVAVGRMCANCGKPLMITCSQCKQDVPLWVYPQGRCPNCGNKLF
jgi:DNA-directed RNA polymerase subunit RPC12/RpoP